MRVKIECEKCGAKVTIYVLGGWDIERVKHCCEKENSTPLHRGCPMRPGEFGITYDPPRRGF